MYKRIIVPLDGSKLAECVLPHVESLVKEGVVEEISLVSVTESVVGFRPTNLPERRRQMAPLSAGRMVQPLPVTTVPETIGKEQAQAERYLTRIAKRLSAIGVKAQTKVLLGNPAEEIVKYADSNNADLIIVASHGRSGVSRWTHNIGAYGGVADKVIRASHIPVLMVKASAGASAVK